MTESVGEQLCAAIRAAPDDRALRLVYADWLMERGDPRGEWLALSCGQATEDDAREMRRRALWQAFGKRWEIEDQLNDGIAISYRDGFPYSATLSPDNAHLAPRLARYPLHTLDLTHFDRSVGVFTNSPVLEPVRQLSLSGVERVSEADLVAFLDAPALRRLEYLAIRTQMGADAFWRALARYRRRSQLKHLDLGIELDEERARWVGQSLPALESLWCQDLASDAPLRALAATATFRLRELHIDDRDHGSAPRLSDAAIADVLASPIASALTRLGLYDCNLGARTAAELARLSCASTLQHLRLRTRGNATIARGLADCRFPALEKLELHSCGVDDQLVDVVARFPALTALDMRRNRVGGRGAERIMAALPNLEQLQLDETWVGDRGVQAIARSEHARSLRRLSLNDAQLSSVAIKAIVTSDRLAQLRELALQGSVLRRDDLRAIAHGPFDRMASLDMSNTMARPAALLFEQAWTLIGEPARYERKLELSGRAVPHARR